MDQPELTFRWLGVGGFEWKAAGFTLLLDPFVTRSSVWQVLTLRLAPRTDLIDRHIPQAEAILISHAHYDHLMDALYLAHRSGAALYGSPNAIEIGRIHGIQPNQLQLVGPQDVFKVGPFQVTLMPGEHVSLPGVTPGPLSDDLSPPLRAINYRMDRCDSSLVEIQGRRWLVWHSVETEGAPQADILVVGPEGGKDYFRTLCTRVKPRMLIPIHWENFFRSIDRPLKKLPVRQSFPDTLGLGQGRQSEWDLGEGVRVPVFTPRLLETYSVEALIS